MAKDRRSAEWEALSRRAIREAVVRILSRDGSSALTMERVAAEAGMAKGTLYLYFRNKQQLLESVKEECLGPLQAEFDAVFAAPLPPREKLARFVRRHLGFFDERRDLLRLLLWERELAAARARRQRTDRYRRLLEQVADVVRAGTEAGELRALDPWRSAVVLVEADVALITMRLQQDAPRPVEEDAAMLLDLFLAGLAVADEPARSRP